MKRVFAIAGLVLAFLAEPGWAADAPPAQLAPATAPPSVMPGVPAARPRNPEIQPWLRGDLAGHWSGIWTKFGDPLPVSVTFQKTANGYTGWFESDALQVAGIPFYQVTYAMPDAVFVLKGDTTTAVFKGIVAGDDFTGKFIEGPASGTFALQRTPAPEDSLRVRDVTFKNGKVILAGTLFLPPESPARFRAILFLHGSGAEGRWANRYLAQKFAVRGVAALIYDKRGVGQSNGDWRTASFNDLADDAAAGIRFLQAQPEIHRENVGIYGHSQGGTIAPLVAERAPGVEFVIASAASGLRPDRVEEYSVGNALGIPQLPRGEIPEAQAYVRELVEVAYRGKDRATLDALAGQYKGRSWYFAPPPPGDYYWTLSQSLAGYRPLLHWRNVHARVLLVYGRYDLRVPADESLKAIRTAVEEGDKGQHVLRSWTIPEADHTFTLVGTSLHGGWPRHVPDYAERLVNWVLWDHGGEDAPQW